MAFVVLDASWMDASEVGDYGPYRRGLFTVTMGILHLRV